jgi:hypothetical protein
MLQTLIGATVGTMVAFSALVPAQAQWVIESGRDRNLAINAWGGAKHGTVLRLHEDCNSNNPDCTWHVVTSRTGRHMIVSDRNPDLAINAWGGATQGTVLRLHNTCRPDNPDCTWHSTGGMIVSDRNPNLAINAWGGAKHGTVLRLNNTCRPDNPDCTWFWSTTVGEQEEDLLR